MAAFFAGLSELLHGAGVPLFISASATAVFFMKRGWRDWRDFLGHASASIFVGQMVFWVLDYNPDLSFTVKCACTGFAAYGGDRLLEAAIKRIRKEVSSRPLPMRNNDSSNGDKTL